MTTITDADDVQEVIDLDGVATYYEAHGSGAPLVLLHGGMCAIETFGGLTPILAERLRVYLPERRGHGRTPDVPGPITYEIMAADTVAFLEALDLGPADLMGWSDGGIVGLLVALWRPDLVKRLVFVGSQVNPEGLAPETRAMMDDLNAGMLPPTLRQLYDAVSPDGPEHFDDVFERLVATWKVSPALDLSELASLPAPTLVVVAEDDMPTVAHADAVRRAIPDGHLAVVPGVTHGLPMERPDLLAQMMLDFLQEPATAE
jgi:pimeloyl-ACP methyl ester carboxylesterase